MDTDTVKLRHVKSAITDVPNGEPNKTKSANVSKSITNVIEKKLLDPEIYVRFVQGFAGFLAKRNLIDTGIGLVIGTAFSNMIQTFVDDLLTPLLGLIVGSRMSNWFIVLRKGAKALQYQHESTHRYKYVTIEEAARDGAVTLNVGRAVESVVRFVCLAGAVFALFRVAMRTWEAHKRTLGPILFPDEHRDPKANESESSGDATRECPFCTSQIPCRASKCRFCTADVSGIAAPYSTTKGSMGFTGKEE
ncbi:uncharacterized protein SPPG_07233 [Spizellomyces punctatus DAOM BR117]|uniref:Large conductance mechanosensitive channel protein n=1 Tax=Spizellomyces punctatus (strain DAOM BR117) TaxID=645134 RepID=A0A0L0H8P6_SPIPD|nr:uncharacterized protein SPPG_07233 [Spizellomyces punctatus DAOM BR117]KNC97304.1 hypothetical protein SPPG_07233 [Spizellomyces punctatus DAOM BR117]|eukprot:XP_016605344.1 hypothetical protein SPPG_07233 [Spizellomyces punctatus DAOM BR117]